MLPDVSRRKSLPKALDKHMLSSIDIVTSSGDDEEEDVNPPVSVPVATTKGSRKPSFIEADGTVVPLQPRTPTNPSKKNSQPPLRPTNVSSVTASRGKEDSPAAAMAGLYAYRPPMHQVSPPARPPGSDTQAYHALQLADLVDNEDSLGLVPRLDTSDEGNAELVVCPLRALNCCSVGRHTRREITERHTLHEHLVALANNTQQLQSDNALLQQQYNSLFRKYKAQNSSMKKMQNEIDQLRQFIIQMPAAGRAEGTVKAASTPPVLEKCLPRDISMEDMVEGEAPAGTPKEKESGYVKRLRQRTSSAAQLYEAKENESRSPPHKVLAENIHTPKLISPSHPCSSPDTEQSGQWAVSSYPNESVLSGISSVSFEDAAVREGDPELEEMRQFIHSPGAKPLPLPDRPPEGLQSGRSAPSLSNTHVPGHLVASEGKENRPKMNSPRHLARPSLNRGTDGARVQLARQTTITKADTEWSGSRTDDVDGTKNRNPHKKRRKLGEVDVNVNCEGSLAANRAAGKASVYSMLQPDVPQPPLGLRNVASQAYLKRK